MDQSVFANTSAADPCPPTCQYHATTTSRTAPADDLSVLETGDHAPVFFLGGVHQLKLVKDGAVDDDTPSSSPSPGWRRR